MVVDVFREIGTDIGARAVFDIVPGIRGVGFDKGNQLIEGRVGGGGIVSEDDSFAIAAAFDFTILGIDKPCRPASG